MYTIIFPNSAIAEFCLGNELTIHYPFGGPKIRDRILGKLQSRLKYKAAGGPATARHFAIEATHLYGEEQNDRERSISAFAILNSAIAEFGEVVVVGSDIV